MRRDILRFLIAVSAMLGAIVLSSSAASPATATNGPTNPNCQSTTTGSACTWSDETGGYFQYNSYCGSSGGGCETCVENPDGGCGYEPNWDKAN